MERPAWVPRSIDISVPSVSRIYDFYLGGSHNFEVDREAARRAMEFMPGLPKIMQANRAFMRRAVRFAVAEGITQFLDIGSGIPTFGNVHEVAQAASPGAHVVYVDHDPVAVAHSQAVLAGNDDADVVAADLRKPGGILSSPQVERLIDLNRPVALLLVAILHFVDDADDPYSAVAELRDALPPGSLLILTHASYEGIPLSPERAAGTVDVYHRTFATRWSCARVTRSRGSSRVRHGGTRSGADAVVAAGVGAGGRGSLRLLRFRRRGAYGVTAEPDGPEGRLRRFATIWSRAVFPVTSTSLTRPEFEEELLPLARRLSAVLGAHGFDAEEAKAVGAALIDAHCTDPRRSAAPWNASTPIWCCTAAATARRTNCACVPPGCSTPWRPASRGRCVNAPWPSRSPIAQAALRAQGVVAQALHASEARFRAVFEGAAIGIGIADLDGNILQVNEALLRMFGGSEQTVRGRNVMEWTHPDDAPQTWRLYDELVRGEREHYHLEKAFYRPDGSGPVDQPDGLPAAGRRRQPAVPAGPHGGHHRTPAAQPPPALRGDPRRAHRTAQPDAVLRAAGEGAGRRRRPAVRPVLPRPGRLQDRQRQPRPRGRRPAAGGGRRPAPVLRHRARRDGRPARR